VLTWRGACVHRSHRGGHARKASYYHCSLGVARDCRSTGTSRRMKNVSRENAVKKKCRELTHLGDCQIGQFLLEVRMCVSVYCILGRRAKTAPTPHYMAIGQDVGEATIIPATRFSAPAKHSVRIQNTYPFLQRPDGKNKHGGLRPPPNDGRRKPGPPLTRRSPRGPKPSCEDDFCAPFCSSGGGYRWCALGGGAGCG
jgi:hypothetical protein